MGEEIKKLKSLLKFYYKEGTKIQMLIPQNGGTIVSGKIVGINYLFGWSILIQSDGGSQMKIFLEDIVYESIIPSEFAKKENKKNEKEARDPIPPKLRTDVFRRDKYVCQYCGISGPNAELEVHHVIPVSRGGTDDINNLKTACFKCNRGMGDRI